MHTIGGRARATKVSQLSVALDGKAFGVDFNPAATGVTGAGYTSNDLSPDTATTLFDVDTANDQVVVQSPANAGKLAPTGKLGVDAGPVAGFDVFTTLRKGVAVADQGYATLRTGGAYRFFKVDVLTGTAVPVGSFPAGRQVADIAVRLKQGLRATVSGPEYVTG